MHFLWYLITDVNQQKKFLEFFKTLGKVCVKWQTNVSLNAKFLQLAPTKCLAFCFNLVQNPGPELSFNDCGRVYK